MAKKVYITTPIYYPNDKPHLGSAYTTIVGDALKRFYKMRGYETYYLTGTDEHGEKIQKEAEKRGLTPKDFVDEMVKAFKKAWEKLGIEYDRFIRTSEEDHEKVVQWALQKVYEKGEIYKGVYKGYYCVSCERYYTESDLLDGNCPYHHKPPELREIETYFFKLSKYRERLLRFYEENPKFLPERYKEEILNRVKEGLKDLAISRPKSQVYWGIEFPFDKNHVTYVWFDALLNYYSGSDKYWPPDIQLMGKDILWFHSVIWPAMIMALDLSLPRREVAHGFLTVDGKKMSKSLGNVVDPLEVAEKFGSDPLRYYLLIKVPFGSDGDFSKAEFVRAYENELLSDFGNLANRVAVLSNSIELKEGNVDPKLKELVERLEEEAEALAKEYDVEGIINKHFHNVFSSVRKLNAYLNEKEPWKTKDPVVMWNILGTFLYLQKFLYPILPKSVEKILEAFNLSVEDLTSLSFPISPLKANKDGLKPKVKNLLLFKKFDEKVKEGFLKSEGERNPMVSGENVGKEISFNDFMKVKLRVGKILSVEEVEGSDNLYSLTVDLGEEKRHIIAGLKKHYKKDELIGKLVTVVANLKPKKIFGRMSEGMLLAADDGENVSLLTPDKEVKVGSEVR